ncbi:ABC transporter ATP-binding protein [Paenibacillus dakarensis]|uniref:ABC transporter ATP-binding protein n=1 Tax=Paenibacillus dakarensis TaxID=1527293 RepID=UPI0006D577D5|nr:ABC transporter ATP-binding protein [Paenibacillus dakarensis]
MLAVEAVGVTKLYGSKRGVSDLNLEVRQGEVFGFIGPNGAGKSTLIRMIMQLLYPTEGMLKVLGRTLDHEHPDLRKRIGYLPSEIAFYPHMNGKQALELTARAYGLKLEHTPAMEYAERLQWDPGKKIKSYSLGNRKKLGLIIALLHQPELLILDEPTSGLDPLVQRDLFALLSELNKKGGMTIFFSTHVLSEVEKLCDRVAFIREGKLLRVSRLDELSHSRTHRISILFETPGNQIETYDLGKLDPSVTFDGVQHLLHSSESLQKVLAKLSQLPIKDLSIRRPTIEELFMNDYKDAGEGTGQ